MGLRRINWSLVAAIVLALIGWALAGSRLALSDRYEIGDRVRTLEVQRHEDSRRIERIEQKVDRLLERVKP